MNQIRKRLTYANVMSSIAVFLVLGGATAFAAAQLGKNTVGSKQLKKNAVTTAKIKKEAVAAGKIKNGAVTNSKVANGAISTDKIADGAVTTGKLADGAVTTGKLADSAVNSGKLAEAERSQAFRSPVSSSTQNLANGLIGTYGPEQSVTTLTLPAGNFVVTAQSEFINTDLAEDHDAVCRLIDDGTELAEQSITALPGLLFPSAGVTAVGVSDGGRMDLACRQGATNKVSAFKAQIIAIRVGTVTGG
ncbi:MAG: hypothetical protein WD810_04070 [Solirubrobacterales bacterium]